jgi:hypothetical protein
MTFSDLLKTFWLPTEVRTGEEPVSKRTPIFRNIAISNMTVNHSRVAVDIEGLPEMPVSGLRITDLIASAKTGVKAYHTEGLELHQVQVKTDQGLAFQIRDSKDLNSTA